jgi:hypothetical protein
MKIIYIAFFGAGLSVKNYLGPILIPKIPEDFLAAERKKLFLFP